MTLSGAAEAAVLIPLIFLVWATGAAWIKACDYLEARRSHLQRQRTRQSMQTVRDGA
jgi:hypothetical protein